MKLALLVNVSAWIQGLALRGSDLESSDLVCENVGELMTEKLIVIVLTVLLNTNNSLKNDNQSSCLCCDLILED